jgi:hypothetical protein
MRSQPMVVGLALLGLFCLPAPSLAFQRLGEVAVGDRVRLRAGPESVRGVIEAIQDGAIAVRGESTEGTRSFDLAELDRLLVLRGTKRATRRGFFIGVLGGVLIGAVHGSTQSLCTACSGSAAGVEMILFGLLGALVGPVVGSQISVDVWETVTLPGQDIGGTRRVWIGVSVSTR